MNILLKILEVIILFVENVVVKLLSYKKKNL